MLGCPSLPQGLPPALASSGLTAQSPSWFVGVSSAARQQKPCKDAGLLKRPCPAEPENQTRGLLLPSSLYDSAFFQPVEYQGRKCQGRFPWRLSRLLLKQGPEGVAERRREVREWAGWGKKLGWLLRALEPPKQLCDHDLTPAGGGAGDCPTWWAARTSPQRLQP